MKKYLIIITSLLCALPTCMSAEVIYVNGNTSNTVLDGKSWVTAYKSLDTAMIKAAAGDDIWVAKGEYWSPTRYLAYEIKKPVQIYGGFNGNENSILLRDLEVNKTTFNAHNVGNGRFFDIMTSVDFTLDGLNFINTTNHAIYDEAYSENGAMSVEIANCSFDSCRSEIMLQRSNIDISFRSCTIARSYDNMYIGSFEKSNNKISFVSCEFFKNFQNFYLSLYGSDIKFIDCAFTNNTNSSGQIIRIGDAETVELNNITYADNKNSGLIYVEKGNVTVKDLTVERNRFINYSFLQVQSVASLENIVIEKNSFEYNTGAIFNNNVEINGITIQQDTVVAVNGFLKITADNAKVNRYEFHNNLSNGAQYGIGLTFTGNKLSVSNSNFTSNELKGGYGTSFGINCDGSLILNKCKFENNIENNSYYSSGAVEASSSKPNAFLEVSSCDFINNVTTTGSGGGLTVSDYSNIQIKDCNFKNNATKYSGGGMEISRVSGGQIVNCTFIANMSSEGQGGGVFINNSNLKIIGCDFSKNSSLNEGGGICVAHYEQTGNLLQIINTKITDNISGRIGGGLHINNHIVQLINSVIANNQSKDVGGGIYTSTGTLLLKNSTIAFNTNTDYEYGEQLWSNQLTVTNSIIWGSGKKLPMEPNFADKGYVFRYSNIQRGAPGEGNTDLNPLFVDEANGNYRLTCASPLINKGSNSYAPDGLDLDSKTRIFGGTVDMGAYEFPQDPATASAPPTVSFSISNTDACKSEVISFGNATVPLENTKFEWNFGDGTKSQEATFNHAYTQSGTYTVGLKATNACGANATLTKQITVKASFAPTISKATVVCPNEQSEFSTDAQCGTLVWTVIGGTLTSGQGTKNIKVQWGDGRTGNGKVTLNVDNCGAAFCNIPVSIEIPIIPTIFEVKGNTKVCQGGLEAYTSTLKDLSPSTLYTWQAIGGSVEGAKSSGYDLSQININWNSDVTEGKVILTTYNELLKCGGTDTLIVAVRPKFDIEGSDKVCTVGENTYTVEPTGDFTWSVSGTNSVIPNTGVVTWGSTPGKYWVFAQPTTGADYCINKDSLEVELIKVPTVLSIIGPQEVDSLSVQTYVATVSSNEVVYNWQVTGGQLQGSSANQILAYWNGAKPYKVGLTITSKVANCVSPLVELPVTTNFLYKITGKDTVCINTPETYVSNLDPNFTAEVFNWSGGIGTSTHNSYVVSLTQPGIQFINLKVLRAGKESLASKKVLVNAAITDLSIKGATEIAPSGTGTYTYTVSNPKAVTYTYTVQGASTHSRNGNEITVTWGGTEPFAITLNGTVAGNTCPGIPVITEVKKAPVLDNKIVSTANACLNASNTYSFVKDGHTTNLQWSISGGGTIIATGDSDIKVLWGSTPGNYSVTLKYDRFGAQTATLPVVVYTLPSPEIAEKTICGTDPVALNTTLSYSAYAWTLEEDNFTSTSATPLVSKEGLYKVSVKDVNGCEALVSKYIKQIPLPEVDIFTEQAFQYCQDPSSVDITLKTLEGNLYQYEWSLNNTPVANTSVYSFTLPLSAPIKRSYTIKTSVGTCSQSVTREFSVKPKSECDGDGGETCTEPEVSFTVNTSCSPFTFTNTSGAKDQSTWSFGDGTSYVGATPPAKIYNKVGIIEVYLSRKCQSASTKVEVPAVAIFKLESPGCNGKTLTFKDYSANLPGRKILSWTWNFGDGTPDITVNDGGSGKDSRNTDHTFNTAGTYTVSLTVRAENLKGALCTHTASQSVKITETPILDFVINSAGCTSTVYQFADKSKIATTEAKYLWTLQSGSTSTAKNAAFNYTTMGAKTVQLEVTDLWGCKASLSKNFTVVAPLVKGKISTTDNLLLCNGRTATLKAPSGDSYLWKRGNTTVGTSDSYTATIGGKYTVTYSNPTCSITTDTVEVVDYKVNNVITGENKVCVGNAVALYTGLQDSEYSFSWKFGNTVLPNTTSALNVYDAQTSNTGTYATTVTNKSNGCIVTLPTFTVNVYDNPSKPAIVSDLVNVCYGSEFTLSTTANTTGYSLKWLRNDLNTSGTTNPFKILNATELATGSYQLQITDDVSTCTAVSDKVYVKIYPQLSVAIIGETLVCENYPFALNTELNADDYNFDWLRNGISLNYNNSKFSLSKIASTDAGNYTVKITSKGTTNYSGCTTTSAPFAVAVKAGPAAPVITGPDEFCEGSEITITSSVNSNIKWGTGETSQSIKVTLGGSYTVTATNPTTGCVLASTKSVIQNPAPNFGFYPAGVYERCGSDKIYFEGLATYPYYQWYVDGAKFKSPNKALYPTKSGAYTLEVKTDKGCMGLSDTMLITSLECPCFVTNTKDAGDGSLREAINCSNSKEGKDIIKFAITENGGVGPFTISPETALPILTDSVSIDGFSQSGSGIYDIIINGSKYSKNALTLDYTLANCRIAGLVFDSFENSISLKPLVNNNLIERNKFVLNKGNSIELSNNCNNNQLLGNTFETLGNAIALVSESQNNLIENNTIIAAQIGVGIFNKSKGNTIKGNQISNALTNGLLIYTGSSLNLVKGNIIGKSFRNGISIESAKRNTLDSNFVGIDPAGLNIGNTKSGIFIGLDADSNIVTRNQIAFNKEYGVDAEANALTINNNQMSFQKIGILSKGSQAFIAYNTVSNHSEVGISVNNNSTILRNILKDNAKGGIYVASTQNKISKNTITNTSLTGKAIDLHLGSLPEGNLGKTPAKFGTYRKSATGGIVLKGNSVANDSVEVFFNNNIAQQALAYVGSAKTNALGIWELEIPAGDYFDPNGRNYYVNTATTPVNNTSELSSPFVSGCFDCVCLVENVNDVGAGSLRAAVDSAHTGKCLVLNFAISTPDTIRLSTPLRDINVPVTVNGVPGAIADPAITIKGPGIGIGFNVLYEGVTVNNLSFSHWYSGISLKNDYALISDNNIVNTKYPITITGNNNTLEGNCLNCNHTGDNSFMVDTALVIRGNNNIIGRQENEGNKIINSTYVGIKVDQGKGNQLLYNDLTSNTIAIDHIRNGNQNYGAPTQLVGTLLTTSASISGKAKAGDRIQIFLSDLVKVQTALPFVAETIADDLGNWSVPIDLADLLPNNNTYFVTTATHTDGTSELSEIVRVGNVPQICYVTNTQNLGEGSLRTAVDCANNAGKGSAGINAKIVFQLSTAMNTIDLASGLIITNNYGVLIDPTTQVPVTLTTSNSTPTAFTWASNNLNLKNLYFENFSKTLVGSGNNAALQRNQFNNYTTAVELSGANQTISENFFANGGNAILSNGGSLSLFQNTFGTFEGDAPAKITDKALQLNNLSLAILQGNQFKNIESQAISATTVADLILLTNTVTGKNGSLIEAIKVLNTPKIRIENNTLDNYPVGILLNGIQGGTIHDNTLTQISTYGLELINSKNINISKNTVTGLSKTGKPINLHYNTASVSNTGKTIPRVASMTYYKGKLVVYGEAAAYDMVELFRSSDGIDLQSYVTTIEANEYGKWTYEEAMKVTEVTDKYYRATATEDLLTQNTSEASDSIHLNLKVCPVRNTNNTGDYSLRNAIKGANNNECNYITFEIGTGAATIAPTDTLPIITAPYIIIDGTSQPGYVNQPLITVASADQDYAFKSINTPTFNMHGMHTLGYDTAVVLQNSPSHILSYNKFENFETGILEAGSSAKQGLIDSNSFLATGALSCIESHVPDLYVSNNTIEGSFEVGIKVEANNNNVQINKITHAGLTGNSVGISLKGTQRASLGYNTIYNTAVGIKTLQTEDNLLNYNTIGDSSKTKVGVGIFMEQSKADTLFGNKVFFAQRGVEINTFENASVEFHEIAKVDTGVRFVVGTQSNFKSTILKNINVGLVLDQTSNSLIEGNRIFDIKNTGVLIRNSSDNDTLVLNLIGGENVGSESYNESIGVKIENANNHKIGLKERANTIFHNKKGGILVSGGTGNKITFNALFENDRTKARPTAYAIKLENSGNLEKVKPSFTGHKLSATKDTLTLFGTSAPSDSIHLYNGKGGYEEARVWFGSGFTDANGKFSVTVHPKIDLKALLAANTLYLTATGTDAAHNTSPLSDMYIMGDCYVTSLADTNDNDYPLANSLRMAVKCANVQNENVGIFYSVDQFGAKSVKLQGTLMSLKNKYGVRYQGVNTLDQGIVAIDQDSRFNADTLAWYIDPLQGPSRFDHLKIENWQTGVKFDADTQQIVHFEARNITKSSIYFTDNTAQSIVDSSNFTKLHTAIRFLPAAHNISISASTFEDLEHALQTFDTTSQITVVRNTFTNNKDYTIALQKAGFWNISSNGFESGDQQALKAILLENSSNIAINGNGFLADTSSLNSAIDVLSLQLSKAIGVTHNQFTLPNKEVSVRLFSTSNSRIDTNQVWVKGGNGVSLQSSQNNQMVGNIISVSLKDAFELQSSDFNQISRNIVTGTKLNVKPIKLNYNAISESNEGIPTPKFYPSPLSHSIKIINKRRGLFVSGKAQPQDSVEVFFSDSLQPSMNTYIGTAFTDVNGAWELPIPRQYYKKDTISWYHIVATATNLNKSTSETDTVYHIPPQTAKFYVLNRFNDGPNTLRDALRQVDSCDLKAYVIFRIGGTTPYRIQLDSLLKPVSSVNGFVMDGATQLDCDSADYADKRIFVECARIDTAFALVLTAASDSSTLASMWFANAHKGFKIENGSNKLKDIHIIQEDAALKGDTALWILGNHNKIHKSTIMGYDKGLIIDGKIEGNSLYLSKIDSVNVGVTLTNKAFKNTIDSNTFINTDSLAVLIDHSAGTANFVKSNTFGAPAKPIKGTAICIEGAKSQTVTKNRIAYLQHTSDTTEAVGIMLKDTASFNSIINNKIGLDDKSQVAYKGWNIQIKGLNELDPAGNNFVTSNTLVGASLGAIKVSHSNASVISNNIIGDTSGTSQYTIGAFGVRIDSSKNEVLENNSIIDFDSSGIEVKHSDFITMSRNILYSAQASGKGIDLNVKNVDSSNVIGAKTIQTPVIENVILLDTSNMTLSGTTPYPAVVVDIFEGYRGKNQAFKYVNTVISGTDRKWSYQLKRTNFAFDKENYYLAQLKTPEGRSSELSESLLKDSLLCELGKLPEWSVIDDLYNPCPGPEFNLGANLGPKLVYNWTLTPIDPQDQQIVTLTTPIITVKDSSYHINLEMRDVFGCSITDTALLNFKSLPFKPDFIVASEVFVDDTIFVIDISIGREDNAFEWSSTGGNVLPTSSDMVKGPDGKMYPKERVVQMQFIEAGNYQIKQRSLKEGCYYDLEKTISVEDKNGQKKDGDVVLPEMEELTVNPNPVVEVAKVHAVVAHKDPVDLQIINSAGVVVENIRLSGKTDYKLELPVRLPSAIYTFRLITQYKTLTQKVVVLK